MTKQKDLLRVWEILIVAIAVGPCFLGGCGPSLRPFNGSFTLGLEGWEVLPQDRASVVGEDRILNVAMSSSEKVRLLTVLPLDPETELVKISFKVRYQGSVPWTKQQRPSFRIVLQQPGTQGDGGYNVHGFVVNPWGQWETQEMVHLYRRPDPRDRGVRRWPLPIAVVIRIVLDEADGSFQFDEFRVEELITRVTIEHR